MKCFREFAAHPFRNINRLLSSLTTANMVRYFENPFEDYSPESSRAEAFPQEEVTKQIDNYVQIILKKLPPVRKHVDGGLYVGIPGVSYMFYRLSKNPILSVNKQFYLEKQIQYIKASLQSSAGDKTSFLLGDAGVYALAAVLLRESDPALAFEALEQYKSLYKSYLNPKFLKCGGDEFFVGRAGYLAGALWISRELQTQIISLDELYKICDMMVQNGKEYADRVNSPCRLMYHYYNTQYLGAAHGISFILQMLITVPGYLQSNKYAADDIKKSIDYILGLQTESGNWPCCMEEIGLSEHKLVHWCHGAPGTIYLMAKAYLVFNDKKYLNSCIKAAEEVWEKGLLRKGPGICHGVAGNGYVFLLLFRLTNDKKYLYRAEQFLKFLQADVFIQKARLPDNPHSLYEGSAGTVCFLSDFLLPDKAEFPFQDVFCTYNF